LEEKNVSRSRLICRRTGKEPVFFPDFEPGVHIGSRGLKKVKGGYIVSSRAGIIKIVCNPVNVGTIKYSDICIEGAHDPIIMDRDLYNLLMSRLKEGKTNR
jgi:hypothetical protein